MQLPAPRGPLSTPIVRVLAGDDTPRDGLVAAATAATAAATDVLTDDDVQVSLFCLYELHYRGFTGVPDDLEWDGDLLAVRAVLEAAFEGAVRARVDVPDTAGLSPADVPALLFAMTSADGGPGLSRYVARRATASQLTEFLIHRSLYHLKEADPHTWAIPRLGGRAKAALVEIQADEYGGGDPERMHAALFARTMRGLGLDDTYGAYVDLLPAVTFGALNAMSLFGLHRRLRGAIAGHLAAFEMTSSVPNRLYGNGFRRHGHDAGTTWYFDEHVEADAVHEQIAARDLAGGLAADEPALIGDIVFGAAACLALDDLVGAHLVGAWERGASSLRDTGERPALGAAS